MADDIRYSELVFLQAVERGAFEFFTPMDDKQTSAVGLHGHIYVEMVAALVEELYVCFLNTELQLCVARLRRELGKSYTAPPGGIPQYLWDNPRKALQEILNGQCKGVHKLCITYRGLRRIAELRDLLKSERILEPFGVLLSMQYFRRDLEDRLKSGSDVAVSVLYIDMDNFKRINTKFGQNAGDVVMKAYLEITRDCLGLLGEAYRGVGDEIAALVAGQGHERAVEIAETIRKRVAALRCEYRKNKLPAVTASVGVATTPPESRTIDIETVAQDRKQQAKDNGKNRVISK